MESGGQCKLQHIFREAVSEGWNTSSTGNRTSTPERFSKTAITVTWRIIGQADDSPGETPHLLVCGEQNDVLSEILS